MSSKKYFPQARPELSQSFAGVTPLVAPGTKRRGGVGERRFGFSSLGVPSGFGVVEGRSRWFRGSAPSPQRKSQSPPKPLRAPERILDPTFPLSVRPRWVSTHQRNAVRIRGHVGTLLLPAPPCLWPPLGMAFLTRAFSVSPENEFVHPLLGVGICLGPNFGTKV